MVRTSGSPKSPPSWHHWVSPLLSNSLFSLSLSFWAVDNPHTRKSCLLRPADCSSPPPPSPLPPLPPPSLPPGAPGQLARSQPCHRRCWCSCRCCLPLLLLLLGPRAGSLNPTPAGPQPSSSSETGAVEGGEKGEEPVGRPRIPLLVGTCCHWPADTQKSGADLELCRYLPPQ